MPTDVYRETEDRAVDQFAGANFNIAWILFAMPQILFLLHVNLGYFVAILVGGFVGVSLQLAYYRWLVMKFRKPIGEHVMLSALTSAADRLHIDRLPETWMYSSEHPILMSSSNILFSAIVISDTAASDIARSPIPGEAALAEQLLRLSFSSRALRAKFFVLVMISVVSFVWSGTDLPPFILAPDPVGIPGLLWLPFGFLLFFIALIAQPFVIVIHGPPRTGKVERMIVDLYRIPPHLARAQVFKGTRVDERRLSEMLMDYPRNVEENSRKNWRRGERMSFAALLVAIAFVAAIFRVPVNALANIPLLVDYVIMLLMCGALAFIASFWVFLFRTPPMKAWEFDDKSEWQRMEETALTKEIEHEMNNTSDLHGYVARIRTSIGDSDGDLEIYKSHIYTPANLALIVPERMLGVLGRPELLAPYVLTAIRLDRNVEKLENGNKIMAIAMVPLFIGLMLLFPILSGGIFIEALIKFALPASALWFVIVVAWAISLYLNHRREEKRIDLETRAVYPELPNVLHMLIDSGFSPSYRHPESWKRLRCLESGNPN
jgi:hypothetical protein